jgi:threonine/homoserine/homoserine lactone efflux protein
MDGAVLAGVALGLSIAAPFGPVSAHCVQRALSRGFAGGFAAGLGTATVHAAYSCLAAAAVGEGGPWTGEIGRAGRLAAAGILLWLGLRTLLARRVAPAPPARRAAEGWRGCYAAAAALTLLNPATACLFAAAVPAVAAHAGPSEGALPLAAGVFLGSAGWWLALSAAAGAARGRLPIRWLLAANRVFGAAMVGFAAFLALGEVPWRGR